jgi:uncharacterized protein (DUF488 family)
MHVDARSDKRHGDRPLVISVGHGARTVEAFLDLLDEGGVELVVDVRTAPGSRRHPHFGKDPLAQALAAEGIGYRWEPDLGGFRTPDPRSPHTALRHDAFRGYADHMGTEPFRAALARVIEAAAEGRPAVMCSESVWWRCHRRLIADALVARGCRVRHLLDGPRLEEHRLSPEARLVGDELVYDLAPGQQRLV